MVGGPVFGQKPRFKQALFVSALIVAFVALVAGLSALVGCSTHGYLYRPVPAALIPKKPDLPTITSDELRPLSDETYLKLAGRDRLLRQYAEELRSLLEVGGDRRDEK